MTKERSHKTLPNYYLALDITPGVSHNEILHAYNRSKMTYTNGSLASYGLFEGETNQAILEEIEEAFGVLGNPARRREYDLKMGFHSWSDEDALPPAGSSEAPTVITTLKQSARDSIVASAASAEAHDITAPPSGSAPSGSAETGASGGQVSSSNKAFGGGGKFKTPSAADTVRPLSIARKQPAPVYTPDPSFENFEANHEFEKQIREAKSVDGAFLKAVRIYRRMTVDQLAIKCKLSTSHIETVENEDPASMHQPVYLRGHVYLMALALDLPDPQALAISFVQKMRAEGKLPKTPF